MSLLIILYYKQYVIMLHFHHYQRNCNYEGRTESHEQLLHAKLGRADEGECGGRWNQLLCYP